MKQDKRTKMLFVQSFKGMKPKLNFLEQVLAQNWNLMYLLDNLNDSVDWILSMSDAVFIHERCSL